MFQCINRVPVATAYATDSDNHVFAAPRGAWIIARLERVNQGCTRNARSGNSSFMKSSTGSAFTFRDALNGVARKMASRNSSGGTSLKRASFQSYVSVLWGGVG